MHIAFIIYIIYFYVGFYYVEYDSHFMLKQGCPSGVPKNHM